MGRVFWNDSMDPPLGDRPNNLERGYRFVGREAGVLNEELADMLGRIEGRIAQRSENLRIYRDVTDPTLDLDAQAKYDAYYRGHQMKLRRLRRLLNMVTATADTPTEEFAALETLLPDVALVDR